MGSRGNGDTSLETIFIELEGGRYVGPLLLVPLEDLVSGRCSGTVSGSSSGGGVSERGRGGSVGSVSLSGGGGGKG